MRFPRARRFELTRRTWCTSGVPEAEFVPLTVIAGRYRLDEEIGHGAMGSVWRGWHLSLNGPVAVKVIKPALLDSAEAKARFLREARAAASLRSTHVVQILDHGLHGDVPFIVMELLEGESLAQRLEREKLLSFGETARITAQVCRALTLAHGRGIVHRDLKPDNIFLAKEGSEEVAKVLDFGIAKDQSASMTATLETQEGAILGTPYYLSPEQAQGSLEVDHRSDLWALGVIAFECVTGRRPFESNHVGDLIVRICSRPMPVPSSVCPVPPGFDEWFRRAVSRVPEQRFQSSSQLSESLSRLEESIGDTLSDSGARAVLLNTGDDYLTAHTKRRTGVGFAVVTAVVLGLGLIVMFTFLSQNREPDPRASTSASAPAPQLRVEPKRDVKVTTQPTPLATTLTHGAGGSLASPSKEAEPPHQSQQRRASKPGVARERTLPPDAKPGQAPVETPREKERVDFGF